MNDSEIKEIVIARLDVLPRDRKISIGNEGTFSKEELIEHVQKGDKIGKKIVEIEMEFLRSFKKEGMFS
ncbi:hypothetical protein HYT51_00340 [Candidatus Woesearchaeota archaeon]|nr:hypothetical protein [Candidatus Woesearchaeota archaeon]